MSFFKIIEITDPVNRWEFRGFGNYIDLFSTSLFRQALINIGKIWTIGGIITLAISLLIAIILTSGIRGKRFFQATIYLPNVISAVAMATMWIQYAFNSSYGFFTTFFNMIGLESLAKIQWLDAEHKFWALLFSYTSYPIFFCTLVAHEKIIFCIVRKTFLLLLLYLSFLSLNPIGIKNVCFILCFKYFALYLHNN